jgi:glycosyltransferase involved in cell wall biosynthesis
VSREARRRTVDFRPCAIVPVYNHGGTALAVVRGLASLGLPVILVDDGSREDTKAALAEVARAVPGTRLITLPVNQGKGGAVMAALALAREAGYTSALQVDADGQHDLGRAAAFLEAARAEPGTLVAGAPVYDESAPASRLAGRKITNFWVAAETWSRDIPDAMCGFRLYPVEAAVRASRGRLTSRRMGFDIEILVRLHWAGVPMRFLPVKVIYPEGGTSSFRMLEDNVLISLCHAKLCAGMVLRSPLLLSRAIGRAFARASRKD